MAGADIRAQSGGYNGEKGGEMSVDAGEQHVLERTAVLMNSKVLQSLKRLGYYSRAHEGDIHSHF